MTTLIPFSKLSLSENNVRASNGEAEIESFAANIAKNGIIQNLIVNPGDKKGHYKVYGGGRRLRAVALLIETNRLPKNFQLPCTIREASDNVQQEISLSENMMRLAMTAADECRAFANMIDGDMSEEEISQAYGCDIRHVRMRLRLGQLAPPIFAALAAGELTIDAAKSYGLTGDHHKQETVWNALKDQGNENSKHAIRSAMLDNSISSQNSLSLFVGEEAYRAAGGRIELDLFSADDESQWLDGHIVQSLAEAKIIEIAEQFKTKNNLGWVKTSLLNYVDYSETSKFAHYPSLRIELTDEENATVKNLHNQIDILNEAYDETATEEQAKTISAQLDELERNVKAITDRLAPIPEEDQENVGTFVYISREGTAAIHHHLLTNVMTKRGNTTIDDDGNETTARELHSRKLVEELAITRRDILALHIANDPQLALDLVIFKMALGQLTYDNGQQTGLSLVIRGNDDPRQGSTAPATQSAKLREKMLENLDSTWFKEKAYADSFAAFRQIDENSKVQWLAYTMSYGLKASLREENSFANPFQDYLGTICDIDVADYWRPTKDNYFGSIRRDAILDIIGSLGDPSLVARYASAKKGELAEAAEKIFGGRTILEPETKQAALKWVPSVMRFSTQNAANDDFSVEEIADEAEQLIAELAE
jgi:ParB family transcriptional regulator, chromosome partitioning protein